MNEIFELVTLVPVPPENGERDTIYYNSLCARNAEIFKCRQTRRRFLLPFTIEALDPGAPHPGIAVGCSAHGTVATEARRWAREHVILSLPPRLPIEPSSRRSQKNPSSPALLRKPLSKTADSEGTGPATESAMTRKHMWSDHFRPPGCIPRREYPSPRGSRAGDDGQTPMRRAPCARRPSDPMRPGRICPGWARSGVGSTPPENLRHRTPPWSIPRRIQPSPRGSRAGYAGRTPFDEIPRLPDLRSFGMRRPPESR